MRDDQWSVVETGRGANRLVVYGIVTGMTVVVRRISSDASPTPRRPRSSGRWPRTGAWAVVALVVHEQPVAPQAGRAFRL
uniref:Uncharacterized protein n=2 Tax=unclassified Streptomyces TaxID=2593676 RepID=V9Z4F2_9ACTN|nr:hypothetical protein pFRL3_151 [Streptomyces sp. FR1]AHE39412.1 hypothetical protein pFRL4_179 [Streptomyces sp. F2]